MLVGNNTKERGILRFIVFPDKDGDFGAVCLDLNIVEYGKDPQQLMESIQEAAFSILDAARKKHLPDSCLNNLAPNKYWKLANKIQTWENVPPIKSRLTRMNDQTLHNYFLSITQKPYSPGNFSFA